MRLLSFVLAVITAFTVIGSTPADSVKVYFRVGHRQFDPSLGDNRANMQRFVAQVREANAAGDIENIVVRAYASPDGMNRANQRLSVSRCQVIADYIATHTGVNPEIIKTYPGGIAWDELRQLVAANPDVPSQEKIIDILDNTPVWVFNSDGKIIDSRKKQLMDFGQGIPYRWMLTNLFPELRNAVAVSLYITSKKEPQPEQTKQLEQEPVEQTKSVESDKSEISDKSDLAEQVPLSQPSAVSVGQIGPKPYYFALKTNMLFDALLIPNIGAEFYLGNNLSLYGEWMYGWWDNDQRHRYWRIYGGDIGLRWWFGKKAHKKPLTGHHIGGYGGIFTFDFEFGDKGYMGGKPGGTLWDRSLVKAGIEYGYSLPVASRLNIDFSIGIGYLGGSYIEYFPFDNDYYRKKEYNLQFFGPTKAEISLVWLIGRGNKNIKKGGDQ